MNAIPIVVLGLALIIGLIVALVQAAGKGVAFLDQHSAQILPPLLSALTTLGIVLGAVVGSILFLIVMGVVFLYVDAYERRKEQERREAEQREQERQRQEVQKPLIPGILSYEQAEKLIQVHSSARATMDDVDEIEQELLHQEEDEWLSTTRKLTPRSHLTNGSDDSESRHSMN